jgi:hypothetical protein
VVLLGSGSRIVLLGSGGGSGLLHGGTTVA